MVVHSNVVATTVCNGGVLVLGRQASCSCRGGDSDGSDGCGGDAVVVMVVVVVVVVMALSMVQESLWELASMLVPDHLDADP